MRIVLVFLCLLLIGCARPLTPEEADFASKIIGDRLDTSRVRIVNDAPSRVVAKTVPIRPRVTCQARLNPPRTKTRITTTTPGYVIFNRLYANPWFYEENYLDTYPRSMSLEQAMFFGHEMVHVWQWQNRKLTKYHPAKAIREHARIEDPYLFDPDEKDRDFLDYGYEQQGVVVEEYICCAVLDPQAPRTERLRNMLSKYFPLERLPIKDVYVRWNGVKRPGICSPEREE